jgi:hypothetical protein
VTAFGEERLGMLPRVLRRVFEHVAAAERNGARYQVRNKCLKFRNIPYTFETPKHVSGESK